MKFEKFFLIDYRGNKGRVISKFVHVENGKEIFGNSAIVLKILQFGEIQVQTRFCSEEFIKRYSKNRNCNLRNMHVGDPINVYFIPVEEADDKYYAKLITKIEEG